jgi:hypothetical protein
MSAAMSQATCATDQKFFGSFFQKKNCLLPSVRRPLLRRPPGRSVIVQILQGDIAFAVAIDVIEVAHEPHPMRLFGLFAREFTVVRDVCCFEAGAAARVGRWRWLGLWDAGGRGRQIFGRRWRGLG